MNTHKAVTPKPACIHWFFVHLLAAVAMVVPSRATSPAVVQPQDYDSDGYVGLLDYSIFSACLDLCGPVHIGLDECRAAFDWEVDGDIDLADFGDFQRRRGHLPMPLRDRFGQVITVDSVEPYSGRQTCGDCHDDERVGNGSWFQDGRTNVHGELDMRDDYYGDGRYWTKSAGRYGKWGQSFQFMLAAKHNTHASQIDQTTFAWVRDCSGCHPGGGPGEFDRDDQRLFDVATGQFGYEALDLAPEDMVLDGDYSVLNFATGAVRPAPWNITGVSEPDCLLCHRQDRPTLNGAYMTHTWRRGILAAGDLLKDAQGEPVPAFASAGTAGQGWFSSIEINTSTPKLQIDYSVGVNDGSLLLGPSGELSLPTASVTWPPLDRACWGCHPYETITGTVWFDQRDIHYRKFNNLSDDDPLNDIPAEKSTACAYCHPGTLDHNIAKGNSPQLEYRDELDYVNFRTCRDCHLEDSPVRHPDAPNVPGSDHVHLAGMFEVLSCQACHIPYGLTSAVLFRDITVPGSVGTTSRYYSADPLDPTSPDKTRWYPTLVPKFDVDGVERWFPANLWVNIYWANWDDSGTPADLCDDIVAPIYTWRVAQATGASPLPVVTDDDADGRKEINRPEEILEYISRLKGNDANGAQIASRPVLVRGDRVWYEEPGAPGGISYFHHEGTGIPMTRYPYLWEMDHNVLAVEDSWGYDDPLVEGDGCGDCHRAASLDSPVFDRLILVDPLGPDNVPVYESLRQQTGLNPP